MYAITLCKNGRLKQKNHIAAEPITEQIGARIFQLRKSVILKDCVYKNEARKHPKKTRQEKSALGCAIARAINAIKAMVRNLAEFVFHSIFLMKSIKVAITRGIKQKLAKFG